MNALNTITTVFFLRYGLQMNLYEMYSIRNVHEVKAWLSIRGKGHFSTEGCILKARFHGCVQLRVTFEHVVCVSSFSFYYYFNAQPQNQVLFSGHRGRVCRRSTSFPGLQKPSSCCDKNQLCQSRREGSDAGFAQEKTGF